MSPRDHTPKAMQLLVLSTSLDLTDKITTSLRNGGLAVHSTRLENLSDLELQLRGDTYDMVLCCAFDPAIKLGRTLEAVNDSERDVPLLVMSDGNGDAAVLLQAMREGARDLVDKDDMEHLQLVVAREYDNLQQRRRLRVLEQRVQESEQRCLTLIDGSHDAIAFIQDGIHVRVNPAYLELFGLAEPADLEDMPLLNLFPKDRHKALKAALKRVENADPGSGPVALGTVCRRPDGGSVKVELVLARSSIEEGQPALQAMLHPVAEEPPAAAAAPEFPASAPEPQAAPAADNLEGQRFLTELDARLAAPVDQVQHALLYLGLDDFGKLHSHLGPERSERLMTELEALLAPDLGEHELLTQFGDGALAVLCRRADADAIMAFADTLRQTVAETTFPDLDRSLALRCSVGVALIGGAGRESHAVVGDAHNACEAAREQGGDRVLLYNQGSESTPEIDAHDARILEQIDNALARDNFRLLYQPIVSLQGDTRENYAVLVRMLDEDGKEILPELFLAQAERYGKMVDIDRWVVRNAIRSLSVQRKEGRKLNFFVSLSEAGAQDKGMLLWICDCLREFDARGGWLTFQIREKYARDHLRKVTKLIDGLKKIKCQIAIDHFGLLPKPEALLSRLQMDFAKLAPGIVRELNSKQERQDELNRLNTLITGQGVKTIATGVEDANSLTVLWTVGVSYIQGYFLQEPSASVEYGTQQLV